MPRVPCVSGVPRRGGRGRGRIAGRASRTARCGLRALRQAVPRHLPAPRHGHRAQVRLEVQGTMCTAIDIPNSCAWIRSVGNVYGSVAVLPRVLGLRSALSGRGPFVALARTFHGVRLLLPAAQQGLVLPALPPRLPCRRLSGYDPLYALQTVCTTH